MSFTTYVLEPSSSRHRYSAHLTICCLGVPFAASLEYQWDGIPGRGEYIRLVFEYTGTPYEEVKDNSTLLPRISNAETVGSPPNLWPPALELPNGKWLSQTGVIVSYLSSKLGLAGYPKDCTDLDEDEKAFLNAKHSQLVFTTLDLMVEVKDA